MNQNKEDFYEKKIKRCLLRKLILLKREFIWFSQVDIFRQDGFYCDYEETLKTPITINPGDYKKLIQRLEKVRVLGKELLKIFENSNENLAAPIAKLKIDCKKKYYNFIKKYLTEIRSTKESPFDLLRKKMADFKS